MRIESSYPTPIQGVSTLSPRNRAAGQAGLQENFRSDPVKKLNRRPSLLWSAHLLDSTSADVKHHTYRRDENNYRILVEEDGTVTAFVNNVSKTVTGNLSSYVDTKDNMVMQTVNDTTFILNKNKTVEMSTGTDESVIENVAHINVVEAMNYGETITVNVVLSWANPGPINQRTATFSTPLVGTSGNFDAADQARATENVATQIASQLTALADITAISKGSSVAIWRDDGEFPDVEVLSGQGSKSLVAVNKVIESTEGLPLYAVHGTRITIKPNPISDKGTYYLEAVGTSDSTILATSPSLRILEDVVWAEERSPTEDYAIDASTMPHTIVYNATTDDFTVGEPSVGWNERRTGDDNSAPVPHFIDKKIKAMSYFQKRLVVLAEDTVSMSETDDLYNWWKASAVQLLVTDPISIASSAPNIDNLHSITTHNKDLLVVASNGQFKIGGSSAVTPQTVSMPLTTSYGVQTSADPVSMGNAVYMPVDFGDSSGVQVYSGQKDTSQDEAEQVARQVIGYMPGTVDLLVANPNISMLALTTSGSLVNEVFIFEQFKQDGKTLQESWSKWILPETSNIIDMAFQKDSLAVICHDNDKIVVKELKMYSTVVLDTEEVVLDDMLILSSTDGASVTIPTDYDITDDTIVVAGSDTDYPLTKVPFTSASTVITFDENISGSSSCRVYVGKVFRSAYRPTRPFRRTESGVAITTDRLNVSKYILSLDNSADVSMKIISDFSIWDDQTFSGGFIGGFETLIGTVPLYTGDAVFSYSQKADLAEAEFYTEGYLGLTISGISWKGKYHQSSGRM